MGIRAESAVAEHDVAGPHVALDLGGLGHVVSAERAGRHAREHAGRQIEQDDPFRHREPAPTPLSGGLAEVGLERRDVGHREARPVLDPDAMAEPPGIVVGRRAGRLGDPFEDRSEDDQGESFPRLAVGGGGEYVAGEVDDMAASGVAVEDLEEEQSDRGDGVEEAFAPGISGVATGVSDGVGGEPLGDISAEFGEDGPDGVGHGRAPLGRSVGRNQPPGCPTPPRRSRCDKPFTD